MTDSIPFLKYFIMFIWTISKIIFFCYNYRILLHLRCKHCKEVHWHLNFISRMFFFSTNTWRWGFPESFFIMMGHYITRLTLINRKKFVNVFYEKYDKILHLSIEAPNQQPNCIAVYSCLHWYIIINTM